MAVNDISDERIVEKTGKSWADWKQLLDEQGSQALAHGEIAQNLMTAGVPGWWAQMLTVKYEQVIGRRTPGQEKDGSYTRGVGKVVDGELDDVYARWLDVVASAPSFHDTAVLSTKQSQSDVWRYWRAELADGTKTVAAMHQQKPGKVGLAVDQQKCTTKAQAEAWKSFWRSYVDDFIDL